MRMGRVYEWTPDSTNTLGGRVTATIVPLLRLASDGDGSGRLWGRHVRVRNVGAVNELDPATGAVRGAPIGDAKPNAEGDFLFQPGRGGGRIDKIVFASGCNSSAEILESGVPFLEPEFRWRYVQASRFGEVNTYFHLDRIAAYTDELLGELGARPLPPVVGVVNAHPAAAAEDGIRDGVRRGERWVPFQGGHYRLSGRSNDPIERKAISPTGEIHLGPGRQLLEHGALVEAAGGLYRANASHNAGILYHEYGHHITRHTADLGANALRPADRQSNRKTALDEGTCDYWAATMLDTPHIWSWHLRHDDQEVHARSLTSLKTMADHDPSPEADAHANGTIWAAALWDLRTRLCAGESNGARQTDRLVLKALLLMGLLIDHRRAATPKNVARVRESLEEGLTALLHADEILNGGRHRHIISEAFDKRGIRPPRVAAPLNLPPSHMRRLLKHVSTVEIPANEDLLSGGVLEEQLSALAEPQLSVIAVGDIMLGGRARRAVAEYGPDYPFEAILPLLRRAHTVLGNLEGPFARKARKEHRHFSYRVAPALATSLTRAGIDVVTLANNHLLDCGRAGVLETLDALAATSVAALGAGINDRTAREPVIRQAGALRIGFLGYYWNRRTAATADRPGSAMDPPEALEADIRGLRDRVNRVVVTFHWGIPYEREPSAEDRAKARFAVDCGADAVIGHHPHVVQPFEIYRGRPIFYSVGNFAFGSANSRAEGVLVGLRFGETRTTVFVYPMYVKNRDPRVHYQPKVLGGRGADRALSDLARLSGRSADFLTMEEGRGRIELPWPGASPQQDRGDR